MIAPLRMEEVLKPGTADPRWTLDTRSKSVDKGLPLAGGRDERELPFVAGASRDEQDGGSTEEDATASASAPDGGEDQEPSPV